MSAIMVRGRDVMGSAWVESGADQTVALVAVRAAGLGCGRAVGLADRTAARVDRKAREETGLKAADMAAVRGARHVCL